MKPSSMLGLSAGWLAMCAFNAVDVGPGDPLFMPSVVLAVPGLIGLVGGIQARRKKTPPEPLKWPVVAGTALAGAAVAMGVALVIIAALGS
jgi:hypothetical protein